MGRLRFTQHVVDMEESILARHTPGNETLRKMAEEAVKLAAPKLSQLVQNRKTAVLMTLGYAAAAYHMVNIYIRAAVGEYTAMAFYPMAAAALYGIYTDGSEEKRPNIKNAALLALSMTGIILSHTLSAEMAVIVMIITCLVMLKKTLRFRTITT